MGASRSHGSTAPGTPGEPRVCLIINKRQVEENIMKSLRALGIAGALAGATALTACDSAAENQVEDQAEAIDESYEAEAELTEALDQGGPDSEASQAQADQLDAQGEEIKDDLEDAADEMDDTPQ
jgi:gas vesicle protein